MPVIGIEVDTMEEATTTQKGLTANTIKLIAIMAMLIDHIAWCFVPTATPLGIIMHVIGRMTMPIMCYFIAEGFFHTRDIKKYAIRLLLFALISQMPYAYMNTGYWLPQYKNIGNFVGSLNVFFTLFLGLIALWACKSNFHKTGKLFSVIGCCVLACFADWMFFGVLFILAFGLNRGNFKKQARWFANASIPMICVGVAASLIQFLQAGVFLSLPLLSLYKGERGGYAWSKWIFYAFYPLHLLILGLIKFGL